MTEIKKYLKFLKIISAEGRNLNSPFGGGNRFLGSEREQRILEAVGGGSLKVLTLVLLILSILSGSAQNTGSIKGTVMDAASQTAIVGANVFVESSGKLKGTTTNASGEFLLSGLAPGEHQLQVTFLGYKPDTTEVFIKSGETIEVSIILQPSAIDVLPIEIIGSPGRSLQSVPGAAAKLKPIEMQLLQPIGTQEALMQVPGITGYADDGMNNSRISIGIRGLNPRRSSRILFLEDGIPIQPAIYVYPNMYYNPPVERIDEIEVIKGSAAIKHGPQTMGGVVNYITSKPAKNFGGRVQVTGGNNGYFSTFGEVAGFGNEKIHPGIQFLYKRANGFRENNSFSQYNGTFKLNIVPDSKNNYYIKANVNYENSNATYTGLTDYSFRTNPRFNPKEHDNFEVFRSSFDVIHTKQINLDLLSTTKFYSSYFNRDWWREHDVFVRPEAYFEQDTIIAVPYYSPGDVVRVGNNRDNFGILRTFYTLGLERSYNYNHKLFGQKGNLEAGARMHWERFIDDKKTGFAPDAREGKYFVAKGADEEWDLYNSWYAGPSGSIDSIAVIGQSHHYETFAFSAFASEKWQTGNLALVPGVRLEAFEQERIDRLAGSKYQDKTTVVVLPGAGFNYKLGKSNLFGGVHRGFTPPSSGALKILNFGANTDTATGLDLKAEKSWNYELGMRGNYKALKFEVAGFYLDIEDMVAAGRGTAFKNLGKVRNWGVENYMNINLSAPDFMPDMLPNIFIVYTFLQTEITNGTIASAQATGDVNIAGNELPYAPRHSLVAGLEKFFDFGLKLRTDIQYVSEVFTDFENISRTDNLGIQGPIPAYWLWNAAGEYSVKEKWTVFFTAKNILDHIYIGSRLHSNPGQPQAHLSSGILPGPRRQVNIGLRYNFGAKK